jgi:molybdate transport system permease protein
MTWSALKLSALVATMATALVAIAGTALGYVLAKRQFRGKELCDAFLTLPMVLPPTVTGYYLIVLLGRRGLIGRYLEQFTGWTPAFRWQGAVIAAGVMALPIMIKSARAALESVDARYEMVSLSLGKGTFETFLCVTLPLASRGLAAGVVLSLARALGEFGATLMLAGNIPGKTQTMPLAIFEAFISGDDRAAQTMVVILTATSILAIYLTNVFTRPASRGT